MSNPPALPAELSRPDAQSVVDALNLRLWTGEQRFPQTSVTTLPTNPVIGQQVVYKAATGVYWLLVYTKESAEYPWNFIGGPPLFAEVETAEALTNKPTFQNLATTGPALTLPLKGDYDIEVGFLVISNAGTPDAGYMSYEIGASAATNADSTYGYPHTASAGLGESTSSHPRRKTALAASTTLTAKYRTNGAGTLQWGGRYMRITPVRVG